MQDTLHNHLLFLHDTLQQLTSQITQIATEAERSEIEARIEFTTQAIDHYRRAYEMERAIREGRSPHLAGMD
jgi:hypothetical protein